MKGDNICLGDVNIDFLRWNDPSPHQKKLIEMMEDKMIPLGATQCVRKYTRSWPGQKESLLDHVWSSEISKQSDVVVDERSSSDHQLVWLDYWGVAHEDDSQMIRKRTMRRFEEKEYIKMLKEEDWEEVMNNDDVNVCVGILTEKITTILDNMAPIKSMQLRVRYAEWLTKETLEKMADRDENKKIAVRIKDKEDWEDYRRKRNKCNRKNREDKQEWTRKKVEEGEK